jgi:hypothetical protein
MSTTARQRPKYSKQVDFAIGFSKPDLAKFDATSIALESDLPEQCLLDIIASRAPLTYPSSGSHRPYHPPNSKVHHQPIAQPKAVRS